VGGLGDCVSKPGAVNGLGDFISRPGAVSLDDEMS